MTMQEKWETVQRLIGGDITSHDLNDLSAYNFNDGQTPPTEEEVEAAFKAWEYRGKRQLKYPNIADQLDMQYHDQLDGTTTWKDAIAKVKSDNPKE